MATATKKKRATKKPATEPRPGTDPRNGPAMEPLVPAQAPKGSPETEPIIGGFEKTESPPSEPKGTQVAKAKPQPLDGIEFADPTADSAVQEDPRINAPAAAPKEQKRTEDGDRANQAAARFAIDRMKNEKPQVVREPPKLPAPTKAELKKTEPKIYRVLAEINITRGASTYRLPAGKAITDRDYDIESLKDQGVQLKEVGT